ncbi:hypothetical protein EG68_11814, partial [Paragonimus skrjabini miyazakii]
GEQYNFHLGGLFKNPRCIHGLHAQPNAQNGRRSWRSLVHSWIRYTVNFTVLKVKRIFVISHV